MEEHGSAEESTDKEEASTRDDGDDDNFSASSANATPARGTSSHSLADQQLDEETSAYGFACRLIAKDDNEEASETYAACKSRCSVETTSESHQLKCVKNPSSVPLTSVVE